MFTQLIPNFIKKAILKYSRNKLSSKWFQSMVKDKGEEQQMMQAPELLQRNINNLKVVLNREILLQQLPVNSICAEIGVDKGEFSDLILKITYPSKLFLIDAWGDTNRYHDGLKELVYNKFEQEIKCKQIELCVGYSTAVLPQFEDNFFDWVYLDTSHTYETTIQELNILKNKVKQNGIIAGHDYVIGNWQSWFKYGVIEAVHEFCVREGWELIYMTIEANHHQSFAIKRLV